MGRKKERKRKRKKRRSFRAFQSRIEERNVDWTRVTGAERGCVSSQRRMNRGAGVIYRWFGKMALPPGESGESRNTVYALVDNESPSPASVGYQRVCHQMQLVCKRDRRSCASLPEHGTCLDSRHALTRRFFFFIFSSIAAACLAVSRLLDNDRFCFFSFCCCEANVNSLKERKNFNPNEFSFPFLCPPIRNSKCRRNGNPSFDICITCNKNKSIVSFVFLFHPNIYPS